MRRIIPSHGGPLNLLEAEQASEISHPKMKAETQEISKREQTNPARSAPLPRNGSRIAARRRARSGLASRFGWRPGWKRYLVAAIGVAILLLVGATIWKARAVLLNNPYFSLVSDQNIQVVGNRIVTAPEVLALFAPDLGQSLFRVPLSKRQSELEQIRWVRDATVMRIWPNRLRIRIEERTPVAFALDGNAVRVVDSQGVLLNLPQGEARQYTFPVLRGITSAESPQERDAQMARYDQFTQALDADGGDISATLSEVDLSDPEDLQAIFIGKPPQPVVHFGTSLFLARYRAFQAHLAEWVQRYPHLRSVDMRYGKQVILDTGTENAAAASAPQASTASGASTSSTHAGKPMQTKQSGQAPRASIASHFGKQSSAKRGIVTRAAVGTRAGIGQTNATRFGSRELSNSGE